MATGTNMRLNTPMKSTTARRPQAKATATKTRQNMPMKNTTRAPLRPKQAQTRPNMRTKANIKKRRFSSVPSSLKPLALA